MSESYRDRGDFVIRSSRTITPVPRSEEHTSELQSRFDLVCRLLLEKKKNKKHYNSLLSSSALFLSATAHHRDLPSFPTRRSSDLRSGGKIDALLIGPLLKIGVGLHPVVQLQHERVVSRSRRLRDPQQPHDHAGP